MNELYEDNWKQLKKSILGGNIIIPVIGPGALMVVFKDDPDSIPKPFYQLVSEELMMKFQVDPQPEILTHTWSLHKAVTAILTNRKGTEREIRNKVSTLIDDYSERVQPAESLLQLVKIQSFTLLISLTPDNLLERAMKAFDDTKSVLVSSYSPKIDTESLADLPRLRPGERGIFKILGTNDNVNNFAMHEEDALEYLYQLQSGASSRFASILPVLRRRDKLLIGCNFPDWLGRAMLRLVNNNRLYAKDTFEFLSPSANDAELNSFLTYYSPNTLGFEGRTDEFIKKLAEEFGTVSAQPNPILTNQAGPTVFVSYASQNAEAARLIAETLLRLGFSDVWLDKKKLIGGDDWSNRINEAIAKCDFFMPILSTEADARREGVFWDEWKTALERARRINDAYLIPVGIDPEPPSKDRYRRISNGDTALFFDIHLLHAQGGVLQAEDCKALTERCSRFLEASHG